MSPKARMIMYPLLAVVVGFFVYTMWFMEPKQPENTATTEKTEQVQTAEVEVESAETSK